MSQRYWTGVGSRETPPGILEWMKAFATSMCCHGWTLRSGGADGADAAFESGARGAADIYLPWRGFNGHRSPLHGVCDEARRIAAESHPAWSRLGGGARSLHARNVYQVLGRTLDAPSEFVVCWTPDGCETEAERTRETGGTATAIVVACRHNVPVFNMARVGSFARLVEFLAARGVR